MFIERCSSLNTLWTEFPRSQRFVFCAECHGKHFLFPFYSSCVLCAASQVCHHAVVLASCFHPFLYVCWLSWSQLLFSFSWVINRVGFTPFMPVLNLLHFYFAFRFVRQQRSLVTTASCFLEVLRHRTQFIPGVFSIDTEITPIMNHPLVFMFIWYYFFPQTLFIYINHIILVVIWMIWNQIMLFWALCKDKNNEIRLWKSQIQARLVSFT